MSCFVRATGSWRSKLIKYMYLIIINVPSYRSVISSWSSFQSISTDYLSIITHLIETYLRVQHCFRNTLRKNTSSILLFL